MSKATKGVGPPPSGLMAGVICGPTPTGSGYMTTSRQSSSTASGSAVNDGRPGTCPEAVAAVRVNSADTNIKAVRRNGTVGSSPERGVTGRDGTGWDGTRSLREVEHHD